VDDIELGWWEDNTVVRFAIAEGTNRIGRRSRCESAVPCSSFSKIHAFLERDGQRVWIEDASSHNGTYVNGEKVSTAELFAGDRIKVGNRELHLVYAGAPLPRPLGEGADKIDKQRAGASVMLAGVVTIALALLTYSAWTWYTGSGPAIVRADPGFVAAVTPEVALARGIDAYLKGELVESQRQLRVTPVKLSMALLALIRQELQDLHKPLHAIDWMERRKLLKAVLLNDPPAMLRSELRRRVEAIERGDIQSEG
jgi:hypothetical protein